MLDDGENSETRKIESPCKPPLKLSLKVKGFLGEWRLTRKIISWTSSNVCVILNQRFYGWSPSFTQLSSLSDVHFLPLGQKSIANTG